MWCLEVWLMEVKIRRKKNIHKHGILKKKKRKTKVTTKEKFKEKIP